MLEAAALLALPVAREADTAAVPAIVVSGVYRCFRQRWQWWGNLLLQCIASSIKHHFSMAQTLNGICFANASGFECPRFRATHRLHCSSGSAVD
jgi:hypothetical protein